MELDQRSHRRRGRETKNLSDRVPHQGGDKGMPSGGLPGKGRDADGDEVTFLAQACTGEAQEHRDVQEWAERKRRQLAETEIREGRGRHIEIGKESGSSAGTAGRGWRQGRWTHIGWYNMGRPRQKGGVVLMHTREEGGNRTPIG